MSDHPFTLPAPVHSADPILASRYKLFAKFASAFSIAIGCTVLAAWTFGNKLLNVVATDRHAMKAGVAVAFILAGISLLLQLPPFSTRRRRLASACAAAVTLAGVLTIAEYVFRWHPGIDQWLVQGAGWAARSRQMPLLGAFALTLIGAALLLSLDPALHKRLCRGQRLAIAVVFISLLPALSYGLHAPEEFWIERRTMIGLHSTVSFLALGLGILAANADRGLMVLTARQSLAGSMVRRLLPLAFLTPIAIIALRVTGEQNGLYEERFGVAIVAWAMTLLFSALVWWYAVNLERYENARQTEEKRFRHLLEATPDPIVIVDEHGIVRLVNTQAERAFGYARDEILGQSVELLVPDELRRAHTTHRHQYSLSPTARSMGKQTELRARRKDGSMFVTEINLSPIQVGSEIWTIAATRDVTERKQAEATLRLAQGMAQSTLDALGSPICVVDRAGTIVACNRAWVEFGAANGAQSAAIGVGASYLNVCDRVSGPEREQAQAIAIGMRAVLAQERDTFTLEYPCHTLGAQHWFIAHITRYAANDEHYLVVAHEEITEARLQELKILRLNRVYSVLSGINAVIVRAVQRQDLFTEACRIAVEHGGFGIAWIDVLDVATQELHPQAQAGADVAYFLQTPRPLRLDRPEDRGVIAQVFASGESAYRNDLRVVANFSTQRLRTAIALGYRSMIALPLTLDGKVVATLSLLGVEADYFDEAEIRLLNELAADISFALEHIAARELLTHLQFHDALTGLPNINLFMDRLRQMIRSADPDHSHVAVALIDLEHFTWLNESLGRGSGDAVLRELGARFMRMLPPNCNVARIGGDTFAIAAVYDDTTAASAVRGYIFPALDEPFVINSKEIRVSAQVGIALFPGDGPDADKVFENAEAALRQAKSSHQSSVYFAHNINTLMGQRMALEADLRIAVESHQFVLHYQPKIDLTNGEMTGAEALIRWQHPQKGLIPPSDFIEIAEENGLIVPIGNWVIDTACAQMAAWRAAGLPIVPVMVNVSPMQFTQSDVLANVQAALTRHGIDARNLELELTETAAAQDAATTAATLKALHKIGIRISLDDFGTGYASLEQIRRFPIDSLKIDRQFTADMTINTENEAIVSAIIAMGHALNFMVVAEGVETEAQLVFLRARGCDEMQGFYFSPALPADALESMLRSGTRMTLPLVHADDRCAVLIVDDEPGVRSALIRVLRPEGYRVLTASSGEAALEVLAMNKVHVVISDQRMPGMDGVDFLDAVKRMHPNAVRMVLSGYTDLEAVTNAVNRGAVFKFLTKPWNDTELRERVREAIEHYRSVVG